MKYLFVSWLFVSLGTVVLGQDYPIYTLEQVRFAQADTVFGLDLSKQKLDELPEEICRFKALKYLNVSRNNLNELPGFLDSLTQLESLDAGKNKFTVFPTAVCRMHQLSTLVLNRNDFSSIPDCIRYAEKLVFIDLWDTPVYTFPDGLSQLSELRKIDLQGVKYGPTFQDQLKSKLPGVEILMDLPCDCME
jgi:Leucine-rich repeat (LRR) protein